MPLLRVTCPACGHVGCISSRVAEGCCWRCGARVPIAGAVPIVGFAYRDGDVSPHVARRRARIAQARVDAAAGEA